MEVANYTTIQLGLKLRLTEWLIWRGLEVANYTTIQLGLKLLILSLYKGQIH